MKKTVIFALIAAMLLGLFCGCGKTETEPAEAAVISFTDSTGRTVELPSSITRIAPSGAVATMILAAAAPDYMVCVANEISEKEAKYIGEGLSELPITGQLYGSKSTINLEELLNAKPDVIIDLGDLKKGAAEDLDALQAQTGIPVIFIQADLPNMAEAFRTLGRLLDGKSERCEAIASYVDETTALYEKNAPLIPEAERVSVMYTTGASGLNTNAKGSSQAQVIDLIGAENAVVVEEVSNKGGGNTINMEQLYIFDPDVIIFTDDSICAEVAGDEAWQQLSAVQSGRCYEIPCAPYNWMSGPPSMNMLLGVRWLGNLLYPELYAYDMVAETQRAYKLLWNCELSEAEARELLAGSTLKRAE
ncbi:MAG: ABC transporter substrate-binding protein [Clostridiales bacterium]|nr:ABC transporter substrate-binding protein [Clostridiales bacterium]